MPLLPMSAPDADAAPKDAFPLYNHSIIGGNRFLLENSTEMKKL